LKKKNLEKKSFANLNEGYNYTPFYLHFSKQSSWGGKERDGFILWGVGIPCGLGSQFEDLNQVCQLCITLDCKGSISFVWLGSLRNQFQKGREQEGGRGGKQGRVGEGGG
jgi:hypothetical protein